MVKSIRKLCVGILVVIIFAGVVSGFIWYYTTHTNYSETPTRNVGSISVNVPLVPIQLRSINYTQFSNFVVNLTKNVTIEYPNGTRVYEKVNYSIRNDSTNTTICFYVYLYLKSTIFDCTIFLDNISDNAFLTANMHGGYRMSEKDIETEKNTLKNDVETIVSISNITVDWTKSQWTINYSD